MRVIVRLAAAWAVCFTVSVSAHHSHGQYEETFRDIEGVVKELHLLTPHSWIYLEVKDASGAPQLWALEATSRTGLERIGAVLQQESHDFEIFGLHGARQRCCFQFGEKAIGMRTARQQPIPRVARQQIRAGRRRCWLDRHRRMPSPMK